MPGLNDMANKGRKVLCQQPRIKYAFVGKHRNEFPVRVMCRIFKIHPSGFYAGLAKPFSEGAIEDYA